MLPARIGAAAAVVFAGVLLLIVFLTAESFRAAQAQCNPALTTGTTGATELEGLYRSAAENEKYQLGEMGWAVLGSINRIETSFGRNLNTSSAGAKGWMQFLPSTWAKYGVDADDDGKKDWNNPADAIYSAANYLRASGAPGDWRGAIFAYNHSSSYVSEVWEWAQKYARAGKVYDAPKTAVPNATAQPVNADAGEGCGVPSSVEGLRAEIVRIAQQELDKGVSEKPMGSNCNPYGPCDLWCAMFTTWVWEKAGVKGFRDSVSKDGLGPFKVDHLAVYAKRHKLWKTGPPEPGDMIVFDEHVSLVEKVLPNGRISIIGGNQSNAVTRRVGTPQSVGASFLGYINPPAAPEGTAA